MINGYSRYATAKIERQIDASHPEPRPTIIPNSPTLRIFNYTEYMIEWDDRPDKLAHRFLGDASLWWKIADANPEVFLWIDLKPGTVIRIPRVA